VRVDDLIAAGEADRDRRLLLPGGGPCAHNVLAKEDVLEPEKVPCERARDVRVAARKVPQLPAPLVRVARVAVNKVERDCGVVQQEGDRVDQQHRGDDRLVGIGWGQRASRTLVRLSSCGSCSTPCGVMPAVSVGDAQRRLYRKNDLPRRHDDLREHPICA
jgi:hypothetical protein